jgi:hypothetical protein
MSELLVAFGVFTRTGSAVMIALSRGGPSHEPAYVGRWDVALMPPDLDSAVYHAASGLTEKAADELVARAEQAAEAGALAALRAAGAALPTGARVLGVAVVTKPVSVPASTVQVLRSHAWMHAAEGVLYREAMLAAARRCGWPAHAADASSLPDGGDKLVATGRAAGRPWRKTEKDAARAALDLLGSA